MKSKHIQRVAVFALLGLLTSVAVAWAAALFICTNPITGQYIAPVLRSREEDPSWYYQRVDAFAVTDVAASVHRYKHLYPVPASAAEIPSWSLLNQREPTPVNPATNLPHGQVEMARGWPMRALLCRRDILWAGDLDWICISGTVKGAWHDAIVLPLPPLDRNFMHDCRALPLRPVWTGMAADTAFWAGAWWIGLIGISKTRRAIRRRRGLCPYCCYDMRGNPDPNTRCPECGR